MSILKLFNTETMEWDLEIPKEKVWKIFHKIGGSPIESWQIYLKDEPTSYIVYDIDRIPKEYRDLIEEFYDENRNKLEEEVKNMKKGE